MDSYDKFIGALYGLAIGDALGSVMEFSRSHPKIPYTGVITNERVTISFRYASVILESGQITDDTEMTLVLLESILTHKMYKRDEVIKAYMKWANTKGTMMGRNTRALFKGVKTLKGYAQRKDKLKDSSQSNGSLMRCLPLVLLPEEKSDIDVSLTNDNSVNREASRIYLAFLRHFIYGTSLTKVDLTLPEIYNVVSDVSKRNIRDVSGRKKGWVCHALYVALYTFLKTKENSFDITMDNVAAQFSYDSDTDTIMAITGALTGAYLGFETMSKEEKTAQNIIKIDSYFSNTSRPYIIDNKLKTAIFERLVS